MSRTETSLRALAERALFGTTLDDKLATATGALVDDAPGPALVSGPATPGRPPELSLDREPDGRLTPPTDAQLEDPRARGRLLHAFANHELLAIELFALALLRFPDAPRPFRAGLARALRDEQAHLAAYLARMASLGVAFGDDAPSAFFWTTLSPVTRPLELVAGLSLTFEQANLDFAAHFAAEMRRAGDDETAALLERVLKDEVEHVRLGATWLGRWKDPAASLWDAWVAALPPPLVPRRARGRGALQREARRAAGLPDDFVRALALSGESIGRPPVVHAFLPAFEHELATSGRSGDAPPAAAGDVARDLACLPMFLARRGDVVLVPSLPEPAWLETLAAAGVEPPELVTTIDDLAERPLSGLAPWGWSPGARALFAPLFAQVRPGPQSWLPDDAHAQALPGLASKTWAARRLAALLGAHPEWSRVVGDDARADVGVVCEDEPAARAALSAITDRQRRAVMKAPWGTSGRGALRVDGPLDTAQATWLARTLERQGAVVVEPWLDRAADLSVQLDVRGSAHEAGKDVRVVGVTRFFADRRGQYAGHVVGRFDAGLDADARRLVFGREGGALSGLDVLLAAATAVGDDLAAAGHRGPAGADALLFRESSGALRLRPLVEVNPRTTMGRVALALGERVAPGHVGLWLHVPAPRAAKAGHASLAALARRAALALPPSVDDRRRLVAGALCTNDPAAARVVLSLLVVERTLEGCEAALCGLGLDVPSPR